jgi:hypothetical protein
MFENGRNTNQLQTTLQIYRNLGLSRSIRERLESPLRLVGVVTSACWSVDIVGCN